LQIFASKLCHLSCVYLGAHAPNLSDEDVVLVHKLWLQVSNILSRRVHHRNIVRVALNRLERDLRGHTDVMLDFYKLEQEGENGKLKGKSKEADQIINEVVHSD
jgi:hypothetical protein